MIVNVFEMDGYRIEMVRDDSEIENESGEMSSERMGIGSRDDSEIENESGRMSSE